MSHHGKVTDLKLPAIVDLSAVEQFIENWKGGGEQQGVLIDAADVERIGQVGLQWLLSVDKTVAASGGQFDIRPCSPALRKAAELAGVAERLCIAED